MGIFWFFGSVRGESRRITTLLWRGTVLDRLWASQSDSLQVARASGRYGWASLPVCSGATLTTAGIGWSPTPPLGMEISGCNHRHTGSKGMSLASSRATCCAAELASSSLPVHYCCFFYSQEYLRAAFVYTLFGEIQTGYSL